jgi:Tol biopolymer transport system component
VGWTYGWERHGIQWATSGGVTDGKVSLLAMRWANGAIVEYGIYVFEVDPDHLSSHSAVACGEGASFLPLGVTLQKPQSMFWQYDWSPDGGSVVFEYFDEGSSSGLLVATLQSNWNSVVLTDSGSDRGYIRYPAWSPDGTRIAFKRDRTVSNYLGFVWDICTIKPNGTDETRIVAAGDLEWLGNPKWSPSSTHLVYLKTTWPRKAPKGGGMPYAEANDVYRAAADGTGAVNLTGDTDQYTLPVAWLAD